MSKNKIKFTARAKDLIKPEVVDDVMACATCRNKVFIVRIPKDDYPYMVCPICDIRTEATGWNWDGDIVDDDDE